MPKADSRASCNSIIGTHSCHKGQARTAETLGNGSDDPCMCSHREPDAFQTEPACPEVTRKGGKTPRQHTRALFPLPESANLVFCLNEGGPDGEAEIIRYRRVQGEMLGHQDAALNGCHLGRILLHP